MSETKHSPPQMTERLIDAAVDYERSEGIYSRPARQELSEARNAIEMALSLHHELVSALERMTNEVSGMWGAYEPLIREQIGNTNYACVNDKIDAARAVLAKAKQPNLEEPRG